MAKETQKDAQIKITDTAENRAEEVKEQAPGKEQRAVQASAYPAEELASNAMKIFGTRQECVAAALRAAGKAECTISEAKGIVEKFLKREVK